MTKAERIIEWAIAAGVGACFVVAALLVLSDQVEPDTLPPPPTIETTDEPEFIPHGPIDIDYAESMTVRDFPSPDPVGTVASAACPPGFTCPANTPPAESETAPKANDTMNYRRPGLLGRLIYRERENRRVRR